MDVVESLRLFNFIGNCVAFPIKLKALRVDRTAAERNLSLRDPPQAENPAEQDSIFMSNLRGFDYSLLTLTA